MEAITHAIAVLNWYENYTEDEMPPETIWDDSEGISEWFKKIRKKNEDKYKFDSPSGDDDAGDGNSMMGNDLADYFRD